MRDECPTKVELYHQLESARSGEAAALEEVAALRDVDCEHCRADSDAIAERDRLRACVADLESYQSARAAELDRLHEQLRQVCAGQVAASKRVVELEEIGGLL